MRNGERAMATPKDIVEKLDEARRISLTFESHLNQLTNEVATLLPAVNAVKALLKKGGFDKEHTLEDNVKLLIDHHTKLVAENTQLRAKISDRESLLEQLRKVVLEEDA